MQRKITDVFASLVQRMQGGNPEEERALLQDQQQAQAQEQAMLEAFKNLKWTRVISMQEEPAQAARVWDLGPDIVTELQQMADLDEDILEVLEPHFDPIAFQEANQNPQLGAYKLQEDELRDLGITATRIR